MAKKKKTISQLKKELDKWFSIYIRTREMDEDGFVSCFTCGRRNHWEKMHAGHFISRRHLSTRWHPHNVEVQDPKCNLFGQGEQYVFSIKLDQKYGEGTAEDMKSLSNSTMKFSRFDYEMLIDEYKEKCSNII